MDYCIVCGRKVKEITVTMEREWDGVKFLVKNVPAFRCEHCQEISFNSKLVKAIKRHLKGMVAPEGINVVELDFIDVAAKIVFGEERVKEVNAKDQVTTISLIVEAKEPLKQYFNMLFDNFCLVHDYDFSGTIDRVSTESEITMYHLEGDIKGENPEETFLDDFALWLEDRGWFMGSGTGGGDLDDRSLIHSELSWVEEVMAAVTENSIDILIPIYHERLQAKVEGYWEQIKPFCTKDEGIISRIGHPGELFLLISCLSKQQAQNAYDELSKLLLPVYYYFYGQLVENNISVGNFFKDKCSTCGGKLDLIVKDETYMIGDEPHMFQNLIKHRCIDCNEEFVPCQSHKRISKAIEQHKTAHGIVDIDDINE